MADRRERHVLVGEHLHLHVVRAVDRYPAPIAYTQDERRDQRGEHHVHNVPCVRAQVPGQLDAWSVAYSIVEVERIHDRGNVRVVEGRLLVGLVGRGEQNDLVPLRAHLLDVGVAADGNAVRLWRHVVGDHEDAPVRHRAARRRPGEPGESPQQLGDEHHAVAQAEPGEVRCERERQQDYVVRPDGCNPARDLARDVPAVRAVRVVSGHRGAP
mmetsp:Transcript_64864/g.184096  ORF Transcript_64864/g.184096 Transcript_64864/m.184096 type:complete len:213 (-) Transcript_64864:81-719(-)